MSDQTNSENTPPGSGGPDYADTNDRDIQAKQDSGTDDATIDADVDESDVKVLPGTGGPDDVGEIDVDPGELNMSGH
jgi:hypothetical protein